MNALWLALRGISVFSLSSRKGMGTEQHGRKEKGRDVPFCRQEGHYDIMICLLLYTLVGQMFLANP